MEIGLVSNHSSHSNQSNHSVVPALIMKLLILNAFTDLGWTMPLAKLQVAADRTKRSQHVSTELEVQWEGSISDMRCFATVMCCRIVEGHFACEKRQWNLFWSIEWISTLKPGSDSFRNLLCCRNSICCSEAGAIGATADWPLGCGYLRWGSAMD